ncbi:MAG: hypothetical protein ACO1QB_05240 [Verrucomicrobiales bacterium]
MRHNLTIRCLFLLLGCLFFTAGCAGPKFPPANFEEPGWDVTQTQATWRPHKNAPEITGDLIIATNSTGRTFISFSKTLPLITAQSSREGWRIEAPENRKHSAPGKPPARISWFQIVPARAGERLPKQWEASQQQGHFVQLVNSRTGESLQVFEP